MSPIRVQRKRSKGWKISPNTVYVGRPTKFGNPFHLRVIHERKVRAAGFGWSSKCPYCCETVEEAVAKFRLYAMRESSSELGVFWNWPNQPFSELRGKDLACWCPLDQACHADVLLELANK